MTPEIYLTLAHQRAEDLRREAQADHRAREAVEGRPRRPFLTRLFTRRPILRSHPA